MSSFQKLAGTSAPTFQFGIGLVAALLKWTATKFSFRNKADTNYVGIAVQTVDLYDSAGTNKSTLGFPTLAGADRTVNLPTNVPTAGFFVLTDAAGNWSYAAGGNTAICDTVDTTTLVFNSAATVAMFNLPANAIVVDVTVVVDAAFVGGTGATVSIGIAGTVSKYSGSGDADLSAANVYDAGNPGLPSVAGVEAVIATYSAGGATGGSARLLVTYVIPS